MRPACMSWAKILPPAACTASVTLRQAATCSALCSPGVSGYPWPTTEGWIASLMIRPAEARWT